MIKDLDYRLFLSLPDSIYTNWLFVSDGKEKVRKRGQFDFLELYLYLNNFLIKI